MKRLLIPMLLLLAGCATQISSDFQPGDAENAIRRNNETFMAASGAGDVDALMRMYGSEPVLLPPNMGAVRGGDAVRSFWAGFLATWRVDGTLTTDDVIQSEDLAVETGHYTLTTTPKAGGAPVLDSGKYLVAWRKVDGRWLIVRDMFSSSAPH